MTEIQSKYDILSGFSTAAVERMRIRKIDSCSEHPWTKTVSMVLEPNLYDLRLLRKSGDNNNKNNDKNNRTATASLSRPNNNKNNSKNNRTATASLSRPNNNN